MIYTVPAFASIKLNFFFSTSFISHYCNAIPSLRQLSILPPKPPKTTGKKKKKKMSATTTTYSQHPLVLPSLGRGSHLITPFIQSSLKKEIDGIQCGLLHLFVQHTSCALSLNENWDEDVRRDMSDALDKIVVEDKVSLGTFPPPPQFSFLHIFPRGEKGRSRGDGGKGGGTAQSAMY